MEAGSRTGQELRLLRTFSRVELQTIGFWLVLVCLLITLTYFSSSKLDAIRLGFVSSPSPSGNAAPLNSGKSFSVVSESSSSSRDSTSKIQLRDESRGNIKSKKNPMCDLSNKRSDLCDLHGDVRIMGRNSSIILVQSPETDDLSPTETWRIKPYPRKADINAMNNVSEVAVESVGSSDKAPRCTDHHDGTPAAVFSVGGYAGNFFHDFTDVILPLFLTARRYDGAIQFIVVDFDPELVGKYLRIFRNLSNYEIIDFDADNRIHCYRHVLVGLTSHSDFGIDPSRSPNAYTMADFARFMRRTYSLKRDTVRKTSKKKPPRLMVIVRRKTRKLVNMKEIADMAETLGFEVVVGEADENVARSAKAVNSCDVLVGVHGAGLTNMVFLPAKAVVVQVVPWGGLGWLAAYFKGPAEDMGLRYMEYSIREDESTLMEQYPMDHAVFSDPASIGAKGWDAIHEFYLEKQDVRLNVSTFRPVLKKAMELLST